MYHHHCLGVPSPGEENLICLFTFLLLQFSLLPDLSAQAASYTPGEYRANTEERIDLTYEPPEPVSQVQLTVTLPFVASEDSELTVDLKAQSWLGTSHEVNGEAYLVEGGTQMVVHLWRPDSVPQPPIGEGWLVQVGGVIVEIEEVQWRVASPDVYRLYPNPTQEVFHLDFPAGKVPQEVTLHDVAGRQLHRFKVPAEKFRLPPLPAGLYQLCVQDEQGIHHLPLRIAP